MDAALHGRRQGGIPGPHVSDVFWTRDCHISKPQMTLIHVEDLANNVRKLVDNPGDASLLDDSSIESHTDVGGR